MDGAELRRAGVTGSERTGWTQDTLGRWWSVVENGAGKGRSMEPSVPTGLGDWLGDAAVTKMRQRRRGLPRAGGGHRSAHSALCFLSASYGT